MLVALPTVLVALVTIEVVLPTLLALVHSRCPFLIFPLRDAAANLARARLCAAVGAFDVVDLTVCRCARTLVAARTGRRFGLRRAFGVARLTFLPGGGDACVGS